MTKDAIDKPFSLPRLAGRMAGSFVPTAVADLSAAADPVRRETAGFWDSVAARTPARLALPERVDAFGKPLPQNRAQLVDPFLTQRAAEDSDPLLKAVVDEQMTFGKPVKRPGESEEAYRWRLKVLGAAREFMMRQAIGTEAYREARGWQGAKSEERRDILKNFGDKAAQVLNQQLGRDYAQQPQDEQLRRVTGLAKELGVQ